MIVTRVKEDFALSAIPKMPSCYHKCIHGACDANPDEFGNTNPMCEFCVRICLRCSQERYKQFMARFLMGKKV